jgi:hypothetical protein
VEPGQLFELRGGVRLRGEGAAALCVILQDAEGQALEWLFAERRISTPCEWRELRTRFAIPPGAASIVPRFVGWGLATVWVDEVSLTLTGRPGELAAADLPAVLSASNAALTVALHTADVRLNVTDRRTGRTWRQQAAGRQLFLRDARAVQGGIEMALVVAEGALEARAVLRLEGEAAELTVELTCEGDLSRSLAFPHPFLTEPGDLLIMPVNEGISYPVDDESIGEMHYVLYGGHGLCMAWYGVTDGRGGVMAIVETPDDASVRVRRIGERLCQGPLWDPQKGRFGPARRIRYVFLDDGGYVAMAKRYRAYARQTGLLKTLSQKRSERPAVDMLVGAVNVWCWEQDAPAICRQMQQAGIDRILWSNGRPPQQLEQLNEMGVLTSRYDIYQDVMNPANFPRLRGVHGDWPGEAWPEDLMISADGPWTRGWAVKDKEGNWVHCGVLCDSRAPAYARERITEELATHPYRCRFIDTTTASPWRECYHPAHPMTRTESRIWKVALLRLVGEEFGVVTGSETGHDAAVPCVDYFEGMLSLGPYRVPDAGRNMQRLWHEVPERVARFQVGHYYRLPLWELVYHDCVVAQWYWGDYNNKLPAVWKQRDLLNALYGTPPMFMFDRALWEEQRDRFVASYQESAPVVRACGYSEMLQHRWLTEDHAVQQSRFEGGLSVTVNFGDVPFRMADGHVVAPLSKRVQGLP